MGRNGPKSEVQVVANQKDWELLLEEQVEVKNKTHLCNLLIFFIGSESDHWLCLSLIN